MMSNADVMISNADLNDFLQHTCTISVSHRGVTFSRTMSDLVTDHSALYLIIKEIVADFAGHQKYLESLRKK